MDLRHIYGDPIFKPADSGRGIKPITTVGPAEQQYAGTFYSDSITWYHNKTWRHTFVGC